MSEVKENLKETVSSGQDPRTQTLIAVAVASIRLTQDQIRHSSVECGGVREPPVLAQEQLTVDAVERGSHFISVALFHVSQLCSSG